MSNADTSRAKQQPSRVSRRLAWPLRWCRPLSLAAALLVPLTLTAAQPMATTAAEPAICAAVRGNGLRVFAHFGAMARVHETFGPLQGMSGGSSGSLMSFLTDAIYSNPLLDQCSTGHCRPDEKAARLALLFKTLTMATAQVSSTSTGQALSLPGRLLHAVDQQGLQALVQKDPEQAVQRFRALLNTEPFKAAVNPEVWHMLDATPDKPALVNDLLQGIRGWSDFVLDSPKVFVRPGVLGMEVFVELFGRIASLYAMDAPGADRARMAHFLDRCAVPGIGLPWPQVAGLQAGSRTCGALFSEMATQHFSLGPAASGGFLDRPVGSSLSMLATVSAMTGASADLLRNARQDYVAGRTLRWQPDFADWRILYTGREADLRRVLHNRGGYEDLKTLRTAIAPGMRWREILSRSGAEPGQQAVMPLQDIGFTAGGWGNGQPVRALKNMGCDKVVLLDAPAPQEYQKTVARLLGAQPHEVQALFDTAQANSSFVINTQEADAVWCTDWNRLESADILGLEALGWKAPVEVRGSWQTMRPYAPLSRVRNSTLCTPASPSASTPSQRTP